MSVCTYSFNYNGDAVPHLTSVTNTIGTAESYTLGYGTISSLGSPWGGAYGGASKLASIGTTGMGVAHGFVYNGYGEMTSMTTPLGGALGWTYGNSATTKIYREVTQRTTATNTWTFTRDAGVAVHASATLYDAGANSSKVWTFGSNGLAATYDELGPASTHPLHKDFGWTTDGLGNVYMASVSTTLNVGANQSTSKAQQTLDVNGSITESKVYDWGSLTTPVKTYNFAYLNDGNYTSRHILNRVTLVTLTVAAGTLTLVDNWYDTPRTGFGCNQGGMVSRTGTLLHDDANYGTGMVYRGNVYWKAAMGAVQCFAYETTGVTASAGDNSGYYMSTALASGTGYSLPGVLTPNGDANLATTVSYGASWGVASVTGPNGANGTTTNDGYGRPLKTKIPDGAETNYTYTYNGVSGATANTQTATIGSGTGARWKKTTLDGFGRVTRVATGHDSTTVSQADTQYAPCACSPLGKMWRVSQPYAPGGTPLWTTFAYDGSGRTLSVTGPDGSVSTTQYLTVYGSYAGSLVKSTDPAGKWKIQQTDAMGNLARVIEPNPAGGSDWITNYTYNSLGQMVGVSMPRSNGTQTRTFVYSGSDMVSATNPENGTTTYQYDGAHHVTKRTDAKGQETRYIYDAQGRVTQVQHWAGSPLVQQGGQTVNYYYDSNPLNSTYSSNVRGRLAAVTFEGAGSQFAYMYSYNQAGRVTSQRMADADHTFDTGYTWDNEGRMTTMAYPDSGPTYQMTFDAMGRLGSMQAGVGGSTVATATYGIAGEVTALSYFGATETRTYNPVLQMTRQTVSGMMDMEYLFTPGANNGRIASSVDHVLGETLNYSYDGVNRLTLAETPGSGATNVAVGRPATQSSTFGSASAGKAVDGNTDGSYSNGSVSVTNGDANAWWQVDLGLARSIDSVEIFNRTDCCGSRLSDYWVFVSNTPFLATDTPATLVNRAGTWSSHQTSMPNPSVGLTVGGYQGRYVRVQLAGTEYLQLAEVKVNAIGWGQGFGYDGFGNLTTKTATKGSAPVMSVSFDPATNRQYGVTYDANGNPDGPVYDVENRKLADSYAVFPQNGYDHAGKRVKRMTATGMEYYVYGIGGQKLETLTCEYHTYGVPPETYTLLDCGASFNVYFGGKLVKSKGVVVATDRLGSVRANGNGERFAYYPYGEERGTSGDGREKFGTYVRDSATVDYADQRYYGVGTGRFNVPDPYEASAGAGDPTSWNRYSYTQGDPVNFRDPSGLFRCLKCGGNDDPDDDDPQDRLPKGKLRSITPEKKGSDHAGDKSGGASLSKDCQDALKVAQKDAASVQRALKAKSTLEAAVKGTDIDWMMLAAIGVRESAFTNITEADGAGIGVGIFQISVTASSGVTAKQAGDLTWAANWAANLLSTNMAQLAKAYPSLDAAHLSQATAASYNFGTGNISGNPDTIDVGSAGNNYGSNVLALMSCFR